MEFGDGELVFGCYFLYETYVFMPDTEARCWSSHICPLCSTRSHSRIDPYRCMCSRKQLPIILELIETGSIEFDTHCNYFLEIFRHLLTSELYMCWGNSSIEGTVDLIFTRSIDMESFTVKNSEQIHIRACLHRIAWCESEMMWKIDDFSCLFSQYLL